MASLKSESEDLVDPDPYTVVTCWIAAAALVIQFVDFVRNSPTAPGVTLKFGSRVNPQATASLEKLEESLEVSEQAFDVLARAVERGSNDPEREFYKAEFGIGRSSLRLDGARHQAFTSHLADGIARLSALSRWSNHVISQHPEAASRLGQAVLDDLRDSSTRLNTLIRSGADNRALIMESRMVLATARMAVAALPDIREN